MFNATGSLVIDNGEDIMTTVGAILKDKGSAVLATSATQTVLAAVDEMCHRRVGALLVLEGDLPRGVFSERDLMTRVILARRDPATTTVAEVMTHDVVCVAPDVSTTEAMAIMTNRRCRHLPVVDAGHVVGMVSIGDLVRAASHEQEYEIQLLRDYATGKYPG